MYLLVRRFRMFDDDGGVYVQLYGFNGFVCTHCSYDIMSRIK